MKETAESDSVPNGTAIWDRRTASDRGAVVARLRDEVGDFCWSYRHLAGRIGELSLPGHRPIRYPFGKPPGLWSRLTRPQFVFDGLYEPATTYLLSRLVALTRPARAFDLGATQGYFSLVMASHDTVVTAVDAFDIVPWVAAAFDAARRDNAALADRSIKLHPIAVTDVSQGAKEVWFYKSRLFETEPAPRDYRENVLRRLKYRLNGEWWKGVLNRVWLTVQSLDDFCAEHSIEPDLLKIDVDGYEAKVLPGAMRLFERRRPWIVLEIHRDKLLAPFGRKRADVLRPLLELGYRAMLVVGRGRLRDVNWIPLDLSILARLDTGTTDLVLLY